MKFRKDINGLRAIAIIAVVLFHFNHHLVPGGFAGVDVFFVISGFLMTGIIFKGLENNNFCIINFYVARANRIIPSLSVVCLALLVFGWVYLTPLDYQTLSKHIAGSIGFVSNVIYWQESGYFDVSSNSKWLLHTWSLSVEWQFYILYPIVLVLLKKHLSFTNIKQLLIVITGLSFALSVYASYHWPDPAYFLFPTRAWEMLMGGLAFLFPFKVKRSERKCLEWFGILLILASYAFISRANLWPGYLTLIPVLGAYMVLIANREGCVITDNIVAQKVGLWSYSIYLWHWPVVVFGYYFEIKHWPWVGIPLSLMLGFISYHFVECIKFTKLSRISFKSIIIIKPLWMAVFLGVISCILSFNIKIFSSTPAPIIQAFLVSSKTDNNNHYTWDKIQELDKKNKFNDKKYKVLTIGDSQSGDFVNALYKAKLNDNVDIVSRIVQARCEVFFLEQSDVENSFSKNEFIKEGIISKKSCISQIKRVKNEKLIRQANIIILSMFWKNANFDLVIKSIANIRAENKNAEIYVVTQKSFNKKIPDIIFDAYRTQTKVGEMAYEQIPNNLKINDNYQKDILKKYREKYNFKIINILGFLCSKHQCNIYNTNYKPYYYDETHTTREGALYIGKHVKSSHIFPTDFFKT